MFKQLSNFNRRAINPAKILVALLFAFATLAFLPDVLSAQDFSGLFEKIDPSVVTINTVELVGTERGPQRQSAVGSGVIIDDEGLIMTAAHVVQTADAIQVKFADGETVLAQVVSSVRAADVALLKVEKIPESAAVAKMGDSDAVKTGSVSLVIGAPLGVEHSLSVGHVSGKANRPMIVGGTPLRLIQTDAAINHGNSGGPMFNPEGEVIGIVSHILSQGGGSDGIGFAVAINEAQSILLEGTPFWTGFEGQMLAAPVAKIFNVPQESGLLVERVLTGSLADKAGIKGGIARVDLQGQTLWVGGDIILEIQNIVCNSPHDFTSIKESIDSLKPDSKISMKVLRGGKVVDLFVQL